MRIVATEEMLKLRKIFKPYEKGCNLVENAPPEAVKAHKKYYELFNKEREEYIKLLL